MKRRILRNQRFAVIPGGLASEADKAMAHPAQLFGMALDKWLHDYAAAHKDLQPAEMCKVTLEVATIMGMSLGADAEQWLKLADHVFTEQSAVVPDDPPPPPKRAG